MISEFSALVLGLVEGFTEFLPISSTAHLVLTSRILGISQSGFAKSFEIVIQSGAILAVLALYWRKFLDLEVLKRIAVAFIPTGVIGLALYGFVKDYLLENLAVILITLGAGGVLLIAFEYWFKQRTGGENHGAGDGVSLESVSYKKAFWVGVFQSLAIVPGVSRAAATIIGGLLVGLNRATIVEFSFLLAVPVMFAATGLDLFSSIGTFSSSEFNILAIGLVVSFLTAIVSIKFLLRYIKNHSFTGFGVYRIVLALAFLFVFIL